MRRLLPAVLLLLAASAHPAHAGPDDAPIDQPLVPPALGAIVLDGRPDEAAWAAATVLPVPAVPVPVPGLPLPRPLAPEVRLGLADGRLVLALRLDEDPGGPIGLHLFVAPEDAGSAAEAVSIDVRPMALRAPRHRAIGPRGVGRTHYRIESAVDITQDDRWTLEAAIPLADLVESADARLRVALTVYTRTQNVVSTWPADARWQGPAAWQRLGPPAGGWPLAVEVDAARLAAEDAVDAERQAAWLAYLRGAAVPLLPTAPREELLAEVRTRLVEPLLEVRRLRPDLAVPLDCQLGDVFHRLGMAVDAETRYQDALTAAPGWREAAYGLYVKVRATMAATAPAGGPTDLDAMAERAQALFDVGEHPSARAWLDDGRTLAMALLAYKAGNAEWAERDLGALFERYPFDAFIDAHRRLAIRARRAIGEEALRVKADATKALPRARLETTEGDIVLELFHDDARNTVFQFVWLAQHGFYDDCAVHRTVPGFVAQTGDPFSRRSTSRPALVGTGTPGYAIRTELGRRWPLRGYVALANGGANTDGSQFMLFTGTAVHLQGEVTVFARVLEGLDVLDRLHAGPEPSRLLAVTVEGLDPERTYHPSTVAGNRAPPPALPPVRGDPK